MNDFLADAPNVVLRTTLVLALVAITVRMALWILRPHPLP